jgi:hypothetical protein
MADEGWAGSWELPVLDGESLQKIHDIVGQAQTGRNGKVLTTAKINLRTGVITYPG